jgi:hypothetical protein
MAHGSRAEQRKEEEEEEEEEKEKELEDSGPISTARNQSASKNGNWTSMAAGLGLN